MVILLPKEKPDIIVFEDSRKITNVFNSKISNKRYIEKSEALVAMSIARKVGTIDAWSLLIEDYAIKNKIEYFGISAKKKGSKIDSKAFNQITGWSKQSNQHERDSAMTVLSINAHRISSI